MVVKSSPANARDTRDGVSSVGREGPLEEGMATHSSTLAWRSPWTEGLGGLQTRSDVTCMHAWINKIFSAHSPTDGHLDCFHFCSLVNSVALNLYVGV